MKPQSRNLKEQILTLKIERIVPDGYGIGFADGLTVFVPLTAAGDLVKAKIDRYKGTVAFARVVEILEPSADRIAPPCPYFGRCGGCDFQQMNYAAQLRAKAGIVKDALRRIGKIDWQDEIKIIPSPAEWNYRTRVQWKREGNKLGYFEPNSHQVIDVEVCPILAPPLQQELNQWREKLKLIAKDFAEIQAVSGGDAISQRLGNETTGFDENIYAANKIAEEENYPDQNRREKIATPVINLQIGEFDYEFSAETFFQVNHQLLPQFVQTAVGGASGENALDLYCGVGLFSLPLARKFKTVTGVEGNRKSLEFAKKNAENALLTNVHFDAGWVGEWLAKNRETLKTLDLVLLDPPRPGAERETIANLLKIIPRQIVYVSCNPATLARDLRLLLVNDVYQIEQITAFDFFPQTHHVETIVRLIKKT